MALFVSNGLFALHCLARSCSKKRGPPIGDGARGGQSDVPSRRRRGGTEDGTRTPGRDTVHLVQGPMSKVQGRDRNRSPGKDPPAGRDTLFYRAQPGEISPHPGPLPSEWERSGRDTGTPDWTGHEHRDGTRCTQSKVGAETGARGGKIPGRDGTRCFTGRNPEKSALTPALSHRNGRG